MYQLKDQEPEAYTPELLEALKVLEAVRAGRALGYYSGSRQ